MTSHLKVSERCLAYAQEPGSAKVGGVWQDVKPHFGRAEMEPSIPT